MSEDKPSLTGRCHCGAVSYVLSAPIQFAFLCHCRDCGHISAGCRMAGASVPADALEITGELSSYRYSGGKAPIELRFCGTCSTSVVAIPEAYPGTVVVRGNTFDDPAVFNPVKSIFGDTACTWDTLVGASKA